MRSFILPARYLLELAGLAAVIWVHLQFRNWLLAAPAVRRSSVFRWGVGALTVLVVVWLAFGVLGHMPNGYRLLPAWSSIHWVRGSALAWGFASLGGFLMLMLWRRVPRFSGERRGFLRATGSAFVAAPFAAMGYGMFVQRRDFRVREVDVAVPGLPPDLQGLRLVHLSDIHVSPFLSEAELARAVEMANELRGHLAVVTGDLITSRGDPLDACLRQLARLRADAGILGCLGNHEIYAEAELEATREGARLGINFLRQRARRLRFGNATLNVAGVDYQRKSGPYLAGAGKLLAPDATNILLSHNPDVFDVAARQGWDVTVAGHTHGGQITVEILHQTLNIARFITPYIYGLYRNGRSSIWVTRGLGTVGVPARVGAPPEIALLRLCDTS